jgi:hypothetical protein
MTCDVISDLVFLCWIGLEEILIAVGVCLAIFYLGMWYGKDLEKEENRR